MGNDDDVYQIGNEFIVTGDTEDMGHGFENGERVVLHSCSSSVEPRFRRADVAYGWHGGNLWFVHRNDVVPAPHQVLDDTPPAPPAQMFVFDVVTDAGDVSCEAESAGVTHDGLLKLTDGSETVAMFRNWQGYVRREMVKGEDSAQDRELPDTPAGRAGWAVGDTGVCIETSSFFAKGEEVVLVEDDNSDIPWFGTVDGETVCAPCELTAVRRAV